MVGTAQQSQPNIFLFLFNSDELVVSDLQVFETFGDFDRLFRVPGGHFEGVSPDEDVSAVFDRLANDVVQVDFEGIIGNFHVGRVD